MASRGLEEDTFDHFSNYDKRTTSQPFFALRHGEHANLPPRP